MMTLMNRSLGIVSIAALVLVAGCEDPAPTEYIPQTIVAAYLIVGEPVRDIRVMRSQAVLDTFKYANTAIADADVRLIVGDRTLQLAYRTGEDVGEYYPPDTTYLIEPTTNYRLIVTTK